MAEQRLISSMFLRIGREEQSTNVAKYLLINISKLFGFYHNFPNFKHLIGIILDI
jgi:hypothetical protein